MLLRGHKKCGIDQWAVTGILKDWLISDILKDDSENNNPTKFINLCSYYIDK